MAKENMKESAILAQIAFLEAEKKGEVLRDVKNIPVSDRKSIWGATRRRGKLVNTHCPGPGQCKKLTCFHCNCNNYDGRVHHTCGRHSTDDILMYEYESKIVNLVILKCEKDGFSVSRNYAISMASSAEFKLILAIEAIKLDLETREAALKGTGRTAFYTFQDGLMDNCSLLEQQWAVSCRPDFGKRTRDEAISAMEKDDSCMLDFVAKGRSSVYGSTIAKRLTCQKKVEAAMQLYNIEATLRSDRSAFFRARKEEGIQGEALDDVMREYDRSVVAAGKINWPKGVSMKEAAGLVHQLEGKGKKKTELPVIEEARSDIQTSVAMNEPEQVDLIASQDKSVSASDRNLSIPNTTRTNEPLKSKTVLHKKRKHSRSFNILSTVQEQEEGGNAEEAGDHEEKYSSRNDEQGNTDAKGQAELEAWEAALQAVVDCLSQNTDVDGSLDGHRSLVLEEAKTAIGETKEKERETNKFKGTKVVESKNIDQCETQQNGTEQKDFYKELSLEYYLPDDEGEKVRKCNAALLHLYHDICNGIIDDDDHIPDQESIDEVIAIYKSNGPIRRCYAERVIQFCSGSAALAIHFLDLAREKFSELFREQLIDHAGPEKYELQGWIFLQAYVKALLDQRIAEGLRQTADEMEMV